MVRAILPVWLFSKKYIKEIVLHKEHAWVRNTSPQTDVLRIEAIYKTCT